jgi:thiaminase/transcriptional activator TenA
MIGQTLPRRNVQAMADTGREGFTAELWNQIAPTFDAIVEHPFLRGIADGTLPPERFVYFIHQDSLYLRAYSRGLSYVAAHARNPADTALFTASAAQAVAVEQGAHAELLEGFGADVAVAQDATLSPSASHYVNTVLAHCAAGPFSEAVASVLACFWIYAEVGKVLVEKGSPDPRYQRWIDVYGDPASAEAVDAVLDVVDRLGAEVDDATRARMTDIFAQGCVLEWMFWDAAWRLERWPILAAEAV